MYPSVADPQRRQYGLIALMLILVSLALRIPFRTEWAYHWDGAQFALAVLNFNMPAGQPQAPGFPLYVLAGKLMRLMTGDAHVGLVWLSVLAGSVLVGLGYRLGAALWGRTAGWTTALILMTSPLCWFHSVVALTNIADAMLVTGLIYAAWGLRSNSEPPTWRRIFAVCGLFIAVAGVRLQSAVMLTPFWVWLMWQCKPWRVRMVMLGGLIAPVAWGLWHLDLILLKAVFDAPKTLWGGGGPDSLRVIAWSLWIGLLAATPFAALGAWRSGEGLIWWWLTPSILFGVVTYTTMPGYVLAYFPAVALLAGAGIARLKKPAPALVAVVLINTLVFCATDYGLTARQLDRQQQALSDALALIRSEYDPAQTLITHRGQHFYFGFRQFQYHLPEYRNLLTTPDASLPGARGRQLWLGQNRVTWFVDEPPEAVTIVEADGASWSVKPVKVGSKR